MADVEPVLVTGATGTTGQAVAAALIARGVAPVVMGRREADVDRVPDGVDSLRVGDFDDEAALARVLRGIAKAYLVTPSSEHAQAQQIRFVEQAARAGVRHLVLLSQLAADADSPVRFLRYHGVVEQRVRELGLGFTFLRPNLFLQGLLMFAGSIEATGSFAAPIGEAAVSVVDVRDIGEVAAVALTDDGHQGRTYTLTGPEAVTHPQVAAALSAATGRSITFHDVDPHDFAQQLAGFMPAWQAEGLVEDYAHYRRGEAAAVTTDITDVTGGPARSLEAFAREYAGAFR